MVWLALQVTAQGAGQCKMSGVGSVVRVPGQSQAALPNHVTLGKLLNVAVPQFCHLKNGNNNAKIQPLQLL